MVGCYCQGRIITKYVLASTSIVFRNPFSGKAKLSERCQSRPWMSSFQCRELLTKGQVFKKEATTSTEEPKKYAYQESDGIYHAKVLSHFACGRQRRMLYGTDSPSRLDKLLLKSEDGGCPSRTRAAFHAAYAPFVTNGWGLPCATTSTRSFSRPQCKRPGGL